MFNQLLLNTEVQDFIRSYKDEIFKLILAGSPFKNITIIELVEQIESRRRIEKKLPTWFETSKILYPPKLNLEQTSSEITAKYKASLVSGNSLADITGGFGVDSFYFSRNFEKTIHFEINAELSNIVKHNFETLDTNSIECFPEDGLKRVLNEEYDVIYADPSRRHQSKGKVFFLDDCEPNIPANLSGILANCKTFLLKTSPMLDISSGMHELTNVSEIHIVGVDNEVKELLWLFKEDFAENPLIHAVNLSKGKVDKFSFEWGNRGRPEYGLPQKFLYEPNAAILKSGAFDLISEIFQVKKLHNNTHLYTNDSLIDFPGRRFGIDEVIPYSKAQIKKALTFKKANISIRNFPESVEKLRQKWKIQDGGERYLFFVTNMEGEKVMLICSKA